MRLDVDAVAGHVDGHQGDPGEVADGDPDRGADLRSERDGTERPDQRADHDQPERPSRTDRRRIRRSSPPRRSRRRARRAPRRAGPTTSGRTPASTVRPAAVTGVPRTAGWATPGRARRRPPGATTTATSSQRADATGRRCPRPATPAATAIPIAQQDPVEHAPAHRSEQPLRPRKRVPPMTSRRPANRTTAIASAASADDPTDLAGDLADLGPAPGRGGPGPGPSRPRGWRRSGHAGPEPVCAGRRSAGAVAAGPWLGRPGVGLRLGCAGAGAGSPPMIQRPFAGPAVPLVTVARYAGARA